MKQGTWGSADRSSSELADSLRARFESAWRGADSQAARPRIQDYLRSAPESERSTMLHTLLALEVKFRRERGEQPTAGEYYQLFPEETGLIESLFGGRGKG